MIESACSTFLVNAGLLKQLPKRGKCFSSIPVIPCRRNLVDLLPLPDCQSLLAGLRERTCLDGLDDCNQDRMRVTDLERLVRKSAAQRSHLNSIREIHQSEVRSIEHVISSQESYFSSRYIKHTYKHSNLGRKYGGLGGAQGMVRARLLHTNTVDLGPQERDGHTGCWCSSTS